MKGSCKSARLRDDNGIVVKTTRVRKRMYQLISETDASLVDSSIHVTFSSPFVRNINMCVCNIDSRFAHNIYYISFNDWQEVGG